jgi:DNA modification methylase
MSVGAEMPGGASAGDDLGNVPLSPPKRSPSPVIGGPATTTQAVSALRPYYQDDSVTMYHGDCREMLPSLTADLVLTDPPYGIALAEHGRRGYDWTIQGDADQSVGGSVVEACRQRWPCVAFASPRHPWPGEWRQFLVWDKGPYIGGGGDIKTCWKFTWELIQVAGTGQLNGKRDSAVLRYWTRQDEFAYHPAQKPTDLLGYLIEKTTQLGATVLDPFMGSGSTLRAAKDLGREAIGIEIEERYCEIAAKRCAQEVLSLA